MQPTPGRESMLLDRSDSFPWVNGRSRHETLSLRTRTYRFATAVRLWCASNKVIAIEVIHCD